MENVDMTATSESTLRKREACFLLDCAEENGHRQTVEKRLSVFLKTTAKLLLLLSYFGAMGQTTDFPLRHVSYQYLSNADVRGNQAVSTTFKPTARDLVFKKLKPASGSYLSMEVSECSEDTTASTTPVFKKFYRRPYDLYRYRDKQLDLHVNPVVYTSQGITNDEIARTYFLSRGLEVRGTLDEKVAFYSMLTENQARYPQYVNDIRDSTLVVPYEGFWKQYNETGVDFFRAQGYIDIGFSKSISGQLGFGKHFVGNGIRSLILSDYANNYPYLRINTQTKLFDYTNLFAELIADVSGNASGTFGTAGFSKKYLAMHHLNIKVKPNLHIGLFESVMYGDSTQGLKVAYMNPVIFYRAVEQQNGSEDNAFVGMDFKWNIWNRLSLYGQLVVDELIVSEVLSGDGWWGNKQGFQLGGKYIDAFGQRDLTLQGEVNRVRPYMYAHQDGFRSYSHYNLALSHPLGANFTEYMCRATYLLNEHWNFSGTLLAASYGNDINNENYGRDILKDYTVRRQSANGASVDYGNSHLQGNKTDLFLLSARCTYMARHNLFIDLETTLRNERDELDIIDTSSTIVSMSLRWNVQHQRYLF